MKTKELREKRAALAAQASDILKKAETENRNLSAEEQQNFDRIHADVENLKGQIDRIERQETIDKELAERSDIGRETSTNTPAEPSAADRDMALRSWFLAGTDRPLTSVHFEAAQRCSFNPHARQLTFRLNPTAPRTIDEARALSVGTTTAGGYTVPDELMRSLEVAQLAFGNMRSVATILRTDSGAALPIPTTNDTSNKGAILAENTAVSEQDITFGQLVLDAYKYSSKMVRISVELLNDSNVNLAQLVGQMLGERIARITNEHFTTGTGSSQPNGAVTASTLGKTGANGQTTSITYADLVDLQHSVDPAYRPNARWMMHDSTLKAIKKLVDSENRPLWAPGIAVREPDTILGQSYTVNQDMPVMAASAKSVLYGDFSKYLIRDVGEVVLLRLDERYADLHQVAFLAFSRHDGDLLDAGTNPLKHYANSAA